MKNIELNILKALSNTTQANKKLVNYYNNIHNVSLAAQIDLFKLLERDIRLVYGVFVDFFSYYGIIIDVNHLGYSIYVTDDNETFKEVLNNSSAREFLFDYKDGVFYIARKYTTERTHDLTDVPLNAQIQYNMYEAIVCAMKWLNQDK